MTWIFHGQSGILKGFSLECTGDNIQVPYCGSDEKLMGIALFVCLVFFTKEFCNYSKLTCLFKVNGFARTSTVRSSFMTKYGKFKLPHLWLLYVSSIYFKWNGLGNKLSQIDVTGSSKLDIEISTNNLVVMKNGIHVVYKQHARWGSGCNWSWYWSYSLQR